ncbi:MAG TPA: gluconate 2-dehydrogenase subunit 3 family protein [Ferruginibacter sp.]|nr:gluconate 2-dehydrogenase subunit 3 family protein [Ferruginibacter sp.]HRN80026.1 gluconate 2-dehydrogenase subunit 3 family protein [Ferruginibacter sp.]HRO18466.1 gluconate 2-dehydrogenase subunit 3 family protein [Ferruginibacter sp.]HRQ20658.1 gluconate 2-dehydrogenase subunit 3 family protein [Ferruginibacter sp.]
MNRRKAIISFITLGAGVGALYSGYRVFNWYKTPDWKYLDNHKGLLNELAEVIIPRTDSPGAKDVDAASIIIHLVHTCTRRVEQNTFIDGLKELETCATRNFRKPFMELDASERFSLVETFMQSGSENGGVIGKAKRKLTGRSFFTILKNYTIIAYCTSEKGVTQGLAYVHVPGRFAGCVPIDEQPRTWATK